MTPPAMTVPSPAVSTGKEAAIIPACRGDDRLFGAVERVKAFHAGIGFGAAEVKAVSATAPKLRRRWTEKKRNRLDVAGLPSRSAGEGAALNGYSEDASDSCLCLGLL